MKRSRRLYRLTLGLLVVTLLATLTLEGLLRLVDPWKIGNWLNDTRLLSERAIAPDLERGYSYQPGKYQLSNWTVTITAQRTRYVPDTNSAGCKIVLLGDSGTFGLGVSDANTWANLLAREYPAADIINPAVPGYNIDNVLLLRRAFPDAAGYLYLMDGNDSEAQYRTDTVIPQESAIFYYAWWARQIAPKTQAAAPMTELPDHFKEVLRAIASDPRVVVVAFDSSPLARLAAEQFPVSLMKPYTHYVSRIDSHPDIEGHKEVEAVIGPHFDSLVKQVCK
jgi:hypothetical protein